MRNRRSAIQLPAPHDSVWLADVQRNDWGYYVEYRAPSLDALLAAGCITQLIFDKLHIRERGQARVDEDGDGFHRAKRPLKVEPERCSLMRHIHTDRAHDGTRKVMALPGVPVYLAKQGAEEEADSQPWLDGAAVTAAQMMEATGIVKRVRTVGRRQRAVSWATIGGVLVIPDWNGIKAGVIAAKGAL